MRWLYARAWTGAARPSALFDQAAARLIAAKMLLPGVSVLERLVAQIRDRAAARLWRRLSALPSPDQRATLERLVLVGADDGRQTPLDRLRRGPVHANSVTLVAALKRLDAVRALGVGDLDRVLDEILRGARRAGKEERLRTARAFDAAALVLRDVARVVRDPACRDAAVRATVAAVHGETEIDAAIAAVDALARPPDDHY